MALVNVRLTVYQACLGFIPGFALPEFVKKNERKSKIGAAKNQV
ncbi:TPA: hypothetical protein ACG1UU_002909 [Kluyvera ascorbata]